MSKVTSSSQSYGYTHTLSCRRRNPSRETRCRILSRVGRCFSGISNITNRHFPSHLRGFCNWYVSFHIEPITFSPRGVRRSFFFPFSFLNSTSPLRLRRRADSRKRRPGSRLSSHYGSAFLSKRNIGGANRAIPATPATAILPSKIFSRRTFLTRFFDSDSIRPMLFIIHGRIF